MGTLLHWALDPVARVEDATKGIEMVRADVLAKPALMCSGSDPIPQSRENRQTTEGGGRG